jgi:protein-S-isoprenylcysteine O-methyltransferase Ste14
MKVSRFRVAAGYVVGLLALVLARPSLPSIAIGMGVAAVGEGLRLWASGHIEKTQRLATGGPYAHTRNPLYVGSAVLALGAAVAAASPAVVVAVVLYFAAFYPVVMAEEAGFLRSKFGAEYEAWAAAVPSFLPRLRPAGARSSRFSWGRVGKNREWRTALALPLLAVLFYVRARL